MGKHTGDSGRVEDSTDVEKYRLKDMEWLNSGIQNKK
jgi:hypothetical protein